MTSIKDQDLAEYLSITDEGLVTKHLVGVPGGDAFFCPLCSGLIEIRPEVDCVFDVIEVQDDHLKRCHTPDEFRELLGENSR